MRVCGTERIFGQQLLYLDSDAPQTTLSRIPDVKGLEFDAVIVWNVNDSFSDTSFNQKLLYMATTRAKHYLAIHWAGKRSPILLPVFSRGVLTFNHTSAASS